MWIFDAMHIFVAVMTHIHTDTWQTDTENCRQFFVRLAALNHTSKYYFFSRQHHLLREMDFCRTATTVYRDIKTVALESAIVLCYGKIHQKRLEIVL